MSHLCIECGTRYTDEELVEQHLAILADLGIDPGPDDLDPNRIHICPECTHDF